MPRRFTMGTLVTRWQQLADMVGDDSILSPEWKTYGSQVYGEMWSEVSLAAGRYFETSTTVVANGSASYTEPLDHESIVRIARVIDAAGRERPLSELRPQDEVSVRGRTGDALYYTLVDDQLFLFPKPSSGTYKWYYQQQPTDLSTFADGDIVDVVSPAGEAFLNWGVVAIAHAKHKKDPSFALMQQEKARERLQVWAANRNMYEPRIRGGVDDDAPSDPAEWWPYR